jgi:hypothetical protein
MGSLAARSPANSPQFLQVPAILSYAPATVSLLAQAESREFWTRFRCAVFYGIKGLDKRYANSGHQVR